jgi:hypothetical protein
MISTNTTGRGLRAAATRCGRAPDLPRACRGPPGATPGGSNGKDRWSIFARTMDIAPFAALRYADARAGEIDRCVSLPYDQFGDAGRDERYRRHPHNVVRLIKPRAEQASAHEAARATLQAWRRAGASPLPAAPRSTSAGASSRGSS